MRFAVSGRCTADTFLAVLLFVSRLKTQYSRKRRFYRHCNSRFVHPLCPPFFSPSRLDAGSCFTESLSLPLSKCTSTGMSFAKLMPFARGRIACLYVEKGYLQMMVKGWKRLVDHFVNQLGQLTLSDHDFDDDQLAKLL